MGNKVAVEDACGNTTSYTYDEMNRLATTTLPETDAGIAVTHNYYDGNGNLYESDDALGNTTLYTYNERNNPTQMTQPAPFSNGLTAADPSLPDTTVYDAPITDYRYDTLGNLKEVNDPNGESTYYRYDALGRLRKTTAPACENQHGSPITIKRYNDDGTLASVKSSGPNGDRITSYEYDGFGRVIQENYPTVDAGTPYTRYQYDLRDNQVFVYQAGGKLDEVQTQTKYDELNRVVVTIGPDPDPDLELPQEGSLQTIYQYNTADELWKTSVQPFNSDDTVTAFARTTTNTYDNLGRVIETTYPDPDGTSGSQVPLVEQFHYDANGNVTQDIQVDNATSTSYVTTTEYDALNRGWHVTRPADQGGYHPETKTDYDLNGNVVETQEKVWETASADHWRSTTYAYDAVGRLYMTTAPATSEDDHPITYQYYDPNGNLRYVYRDQPGSTDNQFQAEYQYDELNRQVKSILPENMVTETKYDIASEVVQVTQKGDGDQIIDQVTNYEYDDLGRRTHTYLPLNGGGRPDTSTSYDLLGTSYAETDTQQQTTQYNADEAGRLVEIVYPDTTTETQKYDVFGELTETVDASGLATSYRYDAAGRKIATRVGLDQDENPYDSGTVTPTDLVGDDWAPDGEGSYSLFGDQTGTATWTINNLEAGQDYQVLWTWPQSSLNLYSVTLNVYDGNGTTPLATCTVDQTNMQVGAHLDSVLWESLDTVTTQTGTLRVVLAFSGGMSDTHLVMAGKIRVLDTNEVTYFQYDTLGNLLKETDRLGFTTEHQYDALGREVLSTDSDGGQTHTYYDLAGRTIQITDPSTNTTYYSYDDLDNKTYENVNGANDRWWQYDTHGNQTAEVDREGGVRAFQYDNLDRLTTEMWFTGWLQYDLWKIDHTDPIAQPGYTCTKNYDVLGRVHSLVDTYSSLTYEYDTLGRLTTETIANQDAPMVTLVHGYGANDLNATARKDGLQTQVAVSIGGTADSLNLYHYDTMDRLDQLRQSGSSVSSKFVGLGYDDAGRLTTVARYAGLNDSGTLLAQSSYSYDADTKRVTSIIHYQSNPMVPIDLYGYAYDATGQLAATYQEWTASGTKTETSTYDYDGNGQLLGAKYSGDDASLANEGYAYDANGNRTSVKIGATTSTYGTPDEYNRISSDGYYTYAYDNEGNRTARWVDANSNGVIDTGDTDITVYGWDYRNRLVGVSHRNYADDPTPDWAVDYVYDALNRRISETVSHNGAAAPTQRFVWDGTKTLLEFSGSSALPVKRYLNALDQVFAQEDLSGGTSTAVKWLLPDRQGSTRDVVDNTGAVLTHYSYDTYGNVTSGDVAVTSVLYCSYWYDAPTGQYYVMARWYDPRTGVWTCEDPLSFGAGDTNLNRYCNNSPTNGTDPSGMYLLITEAQKRTIRSWFGSKNVSFQKDGDLYRVAVLTEGATQWMREQQKNERFGAWILAFAAQNDRGVKLDQLWEDWRDGLRMEQEEQEKLRGEAAASANEEDEQTFPPRDSARDRNTYIQTPRGPICRDSHNQLVPSLPTGLGLGLGPEAERYKIWKKFIDWYQAEKKDLSWCKSLPVPPDKLQFETKTITPPHGSRSDNTPIPYTIRVPVLPEGYVWDNEIAMHVLGYHPNATYGIRSKTPTGVSGQQAMYDASGNLITGGLSAGTPDKVSIYSPAGKPGHKAADVDPFDWADQLDRWYGGRRYRDMYLKVRPPCKGPTAKENLVN